MTSKENQIKALDAEADLEEAIGTLYQAYAAKFPKEKVFWTGLATDEANHAKLVRAFRDKVSGGAIRVPELRFKMSQFVASMNEVKDHLRRTEGQLSLETALATASYIENSILESQLLEFLEGDDPQLKDLLARLKTDTGGHYRVLQDHSAGG